jgi:hypothetical protein
MSSVLLTRAAGLALLPRRMSIFVILFVFGDYIAGMLKAANNDISQPGVVSFQRQTPDNIDMREFFLKKIIFEF